MNAAASEKLQLGKRWFEMCVCVMLVQHVQRNRALVQRIASRRYCSEPVSVTFYLVLTDLGFTIRIHRFTETKMI